MSIFKKIITTTLVGVMILLFGNCINIAAQNLNGTCGSGVSWKLDDDTGLLKISGNGSIDSRGWREYKALIKNVVIEEGITSISSWIFEKCGNMETITIPSSIVSIGEYAFENCQNIKEVYYGGTTEDWCKIQFENKYSNPMYYAKHFYNLYETNPLVLQKQQLIKEEKKLIKKEEAYLVYQKWFDNKIAELAQLKNDVEVAQSVFEDISIMMLEKEQEGAQVILSSTDTAIVDAYKALKNASINTEGKIADKEAEIANAEKTVFICKENYESSLTAYKDTIQYKGYSTTLFDAKYNLNSALAVIKSYVSLGLGMEGITVNDVAMNDVQDKVYENWIISFGSEELTAAHNAYISALHQETGIDEAKIKLVEAFKPIKGDAFEKMYTDAINSYIFALETLDIANIAIHDYIDECLRRSTVVANELSRALENLSNLRTELGEPQTNYTEATGLYKELENAEEARKNYIAAYFKNDVDYQQTLSDYTSAKNTLAAAKNALGSPSSYNASAKGFYVEFEEVVTKVEKKITEEATKRINTVYQALVAENEDVAAASNKLEEAKKILNALYASTETEILASTDELVGSNYKTLQDAIKQVETAILDKSAELEKTKTTFEESKKEFKNLSSGYKETTQYKTYHNLLIDAKARHDSSLKNLKSMITLGLGNQDISASDVEVTTTQDLIYEYWNIVFNNSEIENAKNAFIASLDNGQTIDAKRNELINAFKVSNTDAFWIEYSFVVNEYVDSLITLTIANNDLHKYIDICLREVGAEVLQLQNLQAEVTRLETELGTPKTTTTQATGLYKQLEEAEEARIAYIQKYLAEDTNYSVVNNVLSDAHMGFVRAKISASSPILKYQEIEEINIPSTMTSIGDYQFIGFDNLEKVVISEGVVSIGAYAFYNCKKLEQITIPNSLSIIYNNAFGGCESVEKIYYVGTNTEFKDVIIYGRNSALIPSKIIDCPFHDSEIKNVNETNLKRHATCTTPDIYYYSCSKCNGTGTKTFEHGEALGHTGGVPTCTKQAICSRCHQKYGSLSPHVYDKQIPDDKYLATKADCSHKATYYYSCECGKAGTETFEHGVTLPHNFVDGKCTVCNRDEYIIGNLNDDDKVDSKDAIYLLMSTLFPSDYPTNQVCDFDKDGEIKSNDAIYLLMYTLFPSDYPLHNHILVKNSENKPTCSAPGNIEYWHCSECNKYFLDSEMKNEIKFSDSIIEQIAHNFVNNYCTYCNQPIKDAEYALILGDNASYEGDVPRITIGQKEYTLPIPTSTENVFFAGWFLGDEQITNDQGEGLRFWKYEEKVTLTAKWVNEIEIDGVKYIYRGEYPQTRVTDTTLHNALSKIKTTNERGYIEYDGAEYAKVVYNNATTKAVFNDGTKLKHGSTYFFKVEKILWRVLDETKLLLISDLVLDAIAYYDDNENRVFDDPAVTGGRLVSPNNYVFSNLNAWLNNTNVDRMNLVEDKPEVSYIKNGFATKAFGDDPSQYIQWTLDIDNSAASTANPSNPHVWGNSSAFFFTLSYKEKEADYAQQLAGGKAGATDYAIAKEVEFDLEKGGACWWLRSPYHDSGKYALYVNASGNLGWKLVTDATMGVRPAMYLNLSK